MFSNTGYENAVQTYISATASEMPAHQEMADILYGDGPRYTDFGNTGARTISLFNDIAHGFRTQQEAPETKYDFDYWMDGNEAHIQSMLALRMYAEDHYRYDDAWYTASKEVMPKLHSDAMAASLGIEESNKNPPSGVMKDMIAHSILGGTENPFGSVAADVLFKDMMQLGRAIEAGLEDIGTLGHDVAAYAAASAKYAVTGTAEGFLTLDSLRRSFTSDEDEKVRATRIIDTVKQLLQGQRQVLIDLGKESRHNKRLKPFALPAQVSVSNAISEKFTVIEVSGLDRIGLLYSLTREISDLSLTIGSAHIGTYGEKAVDVFYVTDLTGQKIHVKARQKKIHDALMSVFERPEAKRVGNG